MNELNPMNVDVEKDYVLYILCLMMVRFVFGFGFGFALATGELRGVRSILSYNLLQNW